MAAIEIRSLRKRFGDVTALRGIDLTVEEGEVFGFLGPNGAGKSTTIDVVLDYLRPTDGSVSVFGHDAQTETKRVHERLGVLPDAYGLTGHLTARQHVRFAIDSKDADDHPLELLDRVGIAEAADRNVEGFSKGMKQRLLLACALAGSPDLLILDEPSTGLDPNGARRMREIVREEAERGATVFFSSHILGQVEAVADRVGILADGEIVAEDHIDDLRDAVGDAGGTLVLTLDRAPTESDLDAVRNVEGVSGVDANENAVTVACPDERKAAVVDAIREEGAVLLDIESRQTSLEDLFATYTDSAEGEVER
ncbi:ABC transporter ATP-binding protein (plasmid) [Halarchaeum sp. CBA1220]|uniref:ABC transporter ATP-binding protein n=1 Tax=Halarchaeum sp. CBA1220 TaxID=1853682 RepID=UPI000F3A9738|nr:ABC transporter ATP-binding protein [Halarchaeum sp. CBA1220]QLC34823.1 ABC transporter ATP-binding protein [Halarchaeum sp. CBA1220]